MATGRPHPLAGTDWSDVLRRLSVYALHLYRVDRVMEGTGKSPADLAGEVIVQLLHGKIQYDGRRPLLPLLKKALYHDFLDVKKSAGRRTTLILEPSETGNGEIAEGLDSLAAGDEPPPDLLFRKTVYDAIGNDQELKDYACAVLECGAAMPADIAAL